MLASTGRDCIELKQQEETLASGREEKKPQRRINRRVTMVTICAGSLLRCFCGRLQRHLQAWHMYYSVSSAFELQWPAVAQPHIPLIGGELAQ